MCPSPSPSLILVPRHLLTQFPSKIYALVCAPLVGHVRHAYSPVRP